MPARILDGKAAAAQIRAELAERIERLAAAGRRPGLAAVLVGDDEASHIYVGAKQRAAANTGIGSRRAWLPADASQRQVLDAVAELNADPAVHGIIVQLPLPDGLDPVAVQEAIDPAKDVDGLHPWNEGRLLRGDPAGKCRQAVERLTDSAEGHFTASTKDSRPPNPSSTTVPMTTKSAPAFLAARASAGVRIPPPTKSGECGTAARQARITSGDTGRSAPLPASR